MVPAVLNIGLEVADTEAEGPGRRYGIWLQGCPLRCPGCCNPELIPFEGGTPVAVEVLAQRIIKTPEIEGISLLGGEPFAHTEALAPLVEQIHEAGLSVMIYSGYRLAELRGRGDPATDRVLAATDLLLDGRYNHKLPDTARRWVGSTNQVMHFLSDRYDSDDDRFTERETIEIRLINGQVIINGWPGKGVP